MSLAPVAAIPCVKYSLSVSWITCSPDAFPQFSYSKGIWAKVMYNF